MKTFYLFLFFSLPFIAFPQEKIDVLIINREYKMALQLIEKKIEKQPDASLYLKKGFILKSQQNFQEAIKSFLAGLELEPGNKEITSEIADALYLLGNHHDATTYYKRAIEMNPDNLSLAGNLGKNYIQLDKFKEAFEVFENIYKVDSTKVYWTKQYAYCAYHMQNQDLAIRLFNKVISMNPRDYSSYFNLIRLYQKTKKMDEALKIIEKGKEVFPGDAGFYLQQGHLLFGDSNYKEACEAYENYFSASGDSVFKVLMNYGISLYFSKDENKAISILDICAGQVANDPYVLFYLALAHKKLVRYEVAEAYMNAAIESATPSYLPDMFHHLGQILGQQRKFEESVKALKKANELDPTNHEVLFEIATTYEEFNSNKTMALNYYNIYLKEAGSGARNVDYALDRMKKIKEDLFFEE